MLLDYIKKEKVLVLSTLISIILSIICILALIGVFGSIAGFEGILGILGFAFAIGTMFLVEVNDRVYAYHQMEKSKK